MRIFILLLVTAFIGPFVAAQRDCRSFDYEKQQLQNSPELAIRMQEIEQFILHQKNNPQFEQARLNGVPKITIPVVVHIVYNKAAENISDEQVYNQITILNTCFRRLNADTSKTPTRFLGIAADCEIEFQLAISDPK